MTSMHEATPTPDRSDASRVEKNEAQSRYELWLDGELVGVADYSVQDGRVVFPHTEIVPRYRGRGFGNRLVRAALEDVRDSQARVVARCWFVADFIELHREFAGLLADNGGS